MTETKLQIPSFDKSQNRDVFGLTGAATIDHIWPKDNQGSGAVDNTQLLSASGNNQKGNLNKGKVNGIRFSIIEIGKDQNGKTIGQMYVFKNDKWYKVIPVR